jgi:hypothetical protein
MATNPWSSPSPLPTLYRVFVAHQRNNVKGLSSYQRTFAGKKEADTWVGRTDGKWGTDAVAVGIPSYVFC